MSKKGSINFIKNGKLKSVYCHRNAQLDSLGKRLVKFINSKSIDELSLLYDSLILVDEDSPMTKEQIEAFKKYMPAELWREDITWTDTLKYTKDPVKVLSDGFKYVVDYSSFLPGWLNRFRYVIDLDNNIFQVAKGGLEILQAPDEYEWNENYVHSIAAYVVGAFPLDRIPEDWLAKCNYKWAHSVLRMSPMDGIAFDANNIGADYDKQHDATCMHYFWGIDNY